MCVIIRLRHVDFEVMCTCKRRNVLSITHLQHPFTQRCSDECAVRVRSS